MLAEVRSSDFLPMQSFAGHCRSVAGSTSTNAEFRSTEVAVLGLAGLEIAGPGSFKQGAVGGESRAV